MSRVEKKNIRKKRKIRKRKISIEMWVEEKEEEGERSDPRLLIGYSVFQVTAEWQQNYFYCCCCYYYCY